MTTKMTALLVGGIFPAVIFGISALFQKYSTNEGISIPIYLLAVGVGVAIAGLGFYYFDETIKVSFKSFSYAGIFGLLWGIASGLVAYSLLHYSVPISQLVPLYNMNTLVAVLLALVVFSEWKDMNAAKLLSGAALIIAGGVLVANS